MPDVSLLAAFGAGILSFISPCVLPLVPGYISFVSGVSFEEMQRASAAGASRTRRQMLLTSLAFVVGFSLVFIAFGASASALGKTLMRQRAILEKIAGALVIVFGLHLSGILRIKWLDQDTRIQTKGRPAGPLGALLVGVAFAFGWTPCIGPILGAILLYASQQETVGQGVVLLTAYSAGLGIPFLLSALAVNWFFKASGGLRKSMRLVEVVSGALLVGVGLLLVTDRLTLIAQWFTRAFPGLATIG